METINIHPIARMHSDFATKFGIPRQSGLVEELRSTIVFEPEFRNDDALRGISEFLTCGSSGSFPRQSGRAGLPLCARRGWAGIPGWVFLQPVPHSAPIIWVYHVCGCWAQSTPRNMVPFSGSAAQI